MNILTITGNIVADAETRYTNNGKAVCGFKVANNQGFGDNAHTEYYDCSLWGARAEGGLVPLLKKGTKVTVYGEHRTEQREHQGKQFFNNKVFVHDVELGGRGANASQDTNNQSQARTAPQNEPQQSSGAKAGIEGFDDDIPFTPHEKHILI